MPSATVHSSFDGVIRPFARSIPSSAAIRAHAAERVLVAKRVDEWHCSRRLLRRRFRHTQWLVKRALLRGAAAVIRLAIRLAIFLAVGLVIRLALLLPLYTGARLLARHRCWHHGRYYGRYRRQVVAHHPFVLGLRVEVVVRLLLRLDLGTREVLILFPIALRDTASLI